MTFTSDIAPLVLWLIAVGLALWVGESLYHRWKDHHHR